MAVRLQITPELEQVARNVVWFSDPQIIQRDPVFFLAQVMGYGTSSDVRTVWAQVGREGFKEAMEHLPKGILDERSIHFWGVMTGVDVTEALKHARP